MDPAIEEICRRARITDYLAARGVELTRTRRGAKCCCPLPGHKDDTPSFNITTSDRDGAEIFKCFGCLPGFQRVETERGMRTVKDVKVGDILTDVHGVNVTLLAKIPRIDKIVLKMKTSVDNRGIMATPDHVMLVVPEPILRNKVSLRAGRDRVDRFYEVEMRHLRPGDWIPVAIPKSCDGSPTISLQRNLNSPKLTLLEVGPLFSWAVGLYCAEGSISGDRLVNFDVHVKEAEEVREKLDKAFNEEAGLGINVVAQKPRDNGQTVTACHAGLARWLKDQCGHRCFEKRMPSCLRRASPVLQANWAVGLFYGDGNGEETRLACTSEDLVDDLFRVGLICGAIPCRQKTHRTVGKRMVHAVTLRHASFADIHRVAAGGTFEPRVHKNACHVLMNGRWALASRIKQIRALPPKARTVYDLSVDESNTFSCLHAAVHNCGKVGNIITIISLMEGIKKGSVVRRLSSQHGVGLGTYVPDDKALDPLGMDVIGQFCAEDKKAGVISQFALAFLKRWPENDAVNKVSRIYQRLDFLVEEGDAKGLAALEAQLKAIIRDYDSCANWMRSTKKCGRAGRAGSGPPASRSSPPSAP